MGITSAAEAKLDARIRPDITVLRSVTSYPRRHRPALEVLPGGREADQSAGSAGAGLAASGTVAGKDSPSPGSPAMRPAPRAAPVRLTRRGKIVVGVLAVIAVASVAALVWFAVAGQAQAADHVRQPGLASRSMLRIVVRPGESLWTIALRTDPAADPRIVIQQIIDDNALRGTAIRAGQVLWVPRA
jgi:hypothetical protein